VDLVFEPLRRTHDRASFLCGDGALDEWFHKRALQDEKRDVARVFAAVDRARNNTVAGFYGLSAFTIALDSLPDELKQRLPRHDAIPAALIGRLARAREYRGHGVGELLLADAIKRILSVDELAIYAIVVDANDEAREFYRTFGCVPFPASQRRMFLLASTARAALASR
jgi:GNAT superfamily N-acetyltransferase